MLPPFQVGVVVDADTRPEIRHNPRPQRQISNGTAVTDKVARRRLGKLRVECAEEAVDLCAVAVERVLNSCRGETRKVHGLAHHGANARRLEVEPTGGAVVFQGAGRVGDSVGDEILAVITPALMKEEFLLVVLVVAVDEVLHDAARLEKLQLLAVGEDIRQGRNAAIGVDVEVPRLFLLGFRHVDKTEFVVKPVRAQERRIRYAYKLAKQQAAMDKIRGKSLPKLLQQKGNLDTVWHLGQVGDDFGGSGRHGDSAYQ